MGDCKVWTSFACTGLLELVNMMHTHTHLASTCPLLQSFCPPTEQQITNQHSAHISETSSFLRPHLPLFHELASSACQRVPGYTKHSCKVLIDTLERCGGGGGGGGGEEG